MNGQIDQTIKKAEDELKNIQQALSGKFDEAYSDGVGLIKGEITNITAKLKAEALSDISNIKTQVAALHETVGDFEKDMLAKIEVSSKNYEDEISTYTKHVDDLRTNAFRYQTQ